MINLSYSSAGAPPGELGRKIMEGFLAGAVVMFILMLLINLGTSRHQQELERVYIPIDIPQDDEYHGSGWSMIGLVPFIFLLVLFYQALSGI